MSRPQSCSPPGGRERAYSLECVEKLSGNYPRGHLTVCPSGTKCPDPGSFVSTWRLLEPRFGANSDFPDSFSTHSSGE